LVVAFLVLYATLAGISRQLVRHIETVRNTDAKGDGFREAIQHYLRGNWFETQCCLNILLKKNPHDAEALLMMATLLRHIKRYEEAAEVLNQLERIQESTEWRIELHTEKQALVQHLSETK
jgi:thioredoxin-like negative regulator of GroEL